MKTILVPLFTTLVDLLRSRASLHLEMLALRQQLLELREFTVLEMIDKSPTGSATILSLFFEKETDEVVRG